MNLKKSLLATLSLIVPLTAVSQSSASASDTLRLSREQCVAIALQDNPTIKVADLEVKRVDYSKKEVIANLFPSIDFVLSSSRP